MKISHISGLTHRQLDTHMDSPVHGKNARDAKRHQWRDIRTRDYHATSPGPPKGCTRTFTTNRMYAVIMSDSSLLTLFLNAVTTYLGGRCGIHGKDASHWER
ncbi:hypothetical protein BD309DRAFT_971439 [Dichomitus squalens]|nr:hypothetical protein BD309DRAFT_971439 [Dichomitus squalens]